MVGSGTMYPWSRTRTPENAPGSSGSFRATHHGSSVLHPPYGEKCDLEVKLRHLHLMQRTIGVLPDPCDELPEGKDPAYETVDSLLFNGVCYQSWQEAVEREVTSGPSRWPANNWPDCTGPSARPCPVGWTSQSVQTCQTSRTDSEVHPTIPRRLRKPARMMRPMSLSTRTAWIPPRYCGSCDGWAVVSIDCCWSAASRRRWMWTICARGSVMRSPRQ